MINILYIDDNPERVIQVCAYLQRLYSGQQITVTVETCINEGKKQLLAHKFQILLLDVVLPLRIGERPSSKTSLSFLEEIFRRRKYKKPERIVGITAHLGEAPSFQNEFLERNFFFVETPFNTDNWLKKIDKHIRYVVESHEDSINNTIVIPVHGIHTHGRWHQDLEKSLNETGLNFDCFPYKFGFFSVLFFMLPFMRQRHIRFFIERFERVRLANPHKKIIIIAHSFGTFLVVEALRKLSKEETDFSVELLILSGSVLKTTYPLMELQPRVKKIINDCGCNDRPLCFSQLFVYGTGMAGRVGFVEINDDMITNRFFKGGHSLYFKKYKNNDFISEYWINSILDIPNIHFLDDRPPSKTRDIIDICLSTIGPLKPLVYYAFTACCLYLIIANFIFS